MTAPSARARFEEALELFAQLQVRANRPACTKDIHETWSAARAEVHRLYDEARAPTPEQIEAGAREYRARNYGRDMGGGIEEQDRIDARAIYDAMVKDAYYHDAASDSRPLPATGGEAPRYVCCCGECKLEPEPDEPTPEQIEAGALEFDKIVKDILGIEDDDPGPSDPDGWLATCCKHARAIYDAIVKGGER